MVINLYENEFFMRRAIELAKLGWGKTNPNPLVGAVVVKDGRIIAEGFHQQLGCPHAEVEAFNNAEEDVSGATLYVSLEPCSHYGRTPPCAQKIIDVGIKKVVMGMVDPNPKVSGRGIKMLRDAGIEVEVGMLGEEAIKLNEIFINYIVRRKPFVILKTAVTLDGKIATASGDSKWVTGEKARNHVHVIRDRVAAIMVGVNTVLKDNPSLTTRRSDREGTDPVRIVVDSGGKIPVDCNVINSDSKAGVILATTSRIEREKEEVLIDKGVRIIKADGSDGRVDLSLLMEELYRLEIDSILLEGGGILNSSAISTGIVNKVMFFIAPKIVGGEDAPTSVEGIGIGRMCEAIGVKDISIAKFGEDILLEGYIN